VVYIPRHFLVAATAWISRIISSVAQLFSIAVLLPALGKTDFALYSIVISLAGWFSLAEFGLGSATQNRISQARALALPTTHIIRLIPRLITIFFVISIFIAILCSFPLQSFVFREFVKDSPQPIWLIAFVGCFYVAIALLGVSYRIFYGQGRGFLSNIYQSVSSIISLFGLIWFVKINSSISLLQALLWVVIPTFLVSLFPFVQVFFLDFYSKKEENPLTSFETKIYEINMIKEASRFGSFGLMAAFVLLIDYTVMSQTLNASEIGIYNLTSKIFGLIFFIYNALLQAFWPVLTEMLTKSLWKEARIELRRYIFFGTLLICFGTIVTFSFQNRLLEFLAPGKNFYIHISTLSLFGIYFMIRVWSDTYAIALQSIGKLQIFWIFVPFQAIISLISQYILSRQFGLNGIIGGLILSFILTVSWALPREFSRVSVK
jgi:O-antigen/teichoic acid export membrane protein